MIKVKEALVVLGQVTLIFEVAEGVVFPDIGDNVFLHDKNEELIGSCKIVSTLPSKKAELHSLVVEIDNHNCNTGIHSIKFVSLK